MKQIQEWLGHSDISTTANIYAHLDSQSKQLSAATMEQALPLPEEEVRAVVRSGVDAFLRIHAAAVPHR